MDNVDPAAAVGDPQTPALTLSEIAQGNPDLWVAIAHHPNAYPGLLDWLSGVGGADVRAAVAQRLAQSAPTAGPAADEHTTPAADHVPTAARPGKRRLTRGLKVLIGVGATVVVIVVALAVTLALVLPQRNASSDFTTAASAYTDAQAQLVQTLHDARSTLSNVPDGQVADPGIRNRFDAATANAANLVSAQVPAKADTIAGVAAQVAQLRTDTATLQASQSELQASTQALADSHRTWAQNTLTAAITQAQQAYTASADLVDDPSVRDALQQQISQAQATVNSLSQASLDTVSGTVTQTTSALNAAVATFQSHARIRCSNGVAPPTGVDPMVCGGVPSGATTPTVNLDYGVYGMFAMPSQNIGCTQHGYGTDEVICEIINHSWTLPTSLTDACSPEMGCEDVGIIAGAVAIVQHGDVPPWANAKAAKATIPVLKYGQVADFSPAACLSATDGITCWDTMTHHGFKMSASTFLNW